MSEAVTLTIFEGTHHPERGEDAEQRYAVVPNIGAPQVLVDIYGEDEGREIPQGSIGQEIGVYPGDRIDAREYANTGDDTPPELYLDLLDQSPEEKAENTVKLIHDNIQLVKDNLDEFRRQHAGPLETTMQLLMSTVPSRQSSITSGSSHQEINPFFLERHLQTLQAYLEGAKRLQGIIERRIKEIERDQELMSDEQEYESDLRTELSKLIQKHIEWSKVTVPRVADNPDDMPKTRRELKLQRFEEKQLLLARDRWYTPEGVPLPGSRDSMAETVIQQQIAQSQRRQEDLNQRAIDARTMRNRADSNLDALITEVRAALRDEDEFMEHVAALMNQLAQQTQGSLAGIGSSVEVVARTVPLRIGHQPERGIGKGAVRAAAKLIGRG